MGNGGTAAVLDVYPEKLAWFVPSQIVCRGHKECASGSDMGCFTLGICQLYQRPLQNSI